MSADTERRAEYEYVVVGSGAGGGTVARLAEAGCRVLLLEAGGDPLTLQGADPAQVLQADAQPSVPGRRRTLKQEGTHDECRFQEV